MSVSRCLSHLPSLDAAQCLPLWQATYTVTPTVTERSTVTAQLQQQQALRRYMEVSVHRDLKLLVLISHVW